MTILVYSSQKNKAGKDIQTAVARSLKDQSQLRMVASLSELRQWLIQPRVDEASSIVVLNLAHQAELEEMLTVQNLLRKQRLIIVLPEQNAEIVTKAHRLHPRFLSFINGNNSAITDVLNKMQKIEQTVNSPGRKKMNQALASMR